MPKWKERVILYERDVLYTIAFDLNVTHPFKALQDRMKDVRGAWSGRWSACLLCWWCGGGACCFLFHVLSDASTPAHAHTRT